MTVFVISVVGSSSFSESDVVLVVPFCIELAMAKLSSTQKVSLFKSLFSMSSSICFSGSRPLGDLGLVNTFTSLSFLTEEFKVANALSSEEIMVDSKEVSVVFTLLLLRGVELERKVVCDSACLFAVLNMLLLTGLGMFETRGVEPSTSPVELDLPIS
jgi:hypothetical protein